MGLAGCGIEVMARGEAAQDDVDLCQSSLITMSHRERAHLHC
jgi:hypothetical protein